MDFDGRACEYGILDDLDNEDDDLYESDGVNEPWPLQTKYWLLLSAFVLSLSSRLTTIDIWLTCVWWIRSGSLILWILRL